MQDELGFDQPGRPDGLSAWRAQRAEALREFARANGLPLGHPCRVELAGTVLEGRLILAEEILLLPVDGQRDLDLRLQIGRCIFTPREVVSVVRLD